MASAAERKRLSRHRQSLRQAGYLLLQDVPADRDALQRLQAAGILPRCRPDELPGAVAGLLDLAAEPRITSALLDAIAQLAAELEL